MAEGVALSLVCTDYGPGYAIGYTHGIVDDAG